MLCRAEGHVRFPGHYDVMVGGAVGVGESYEDAAARELVEELGAGVPVRFLFTFVCQDGISPVCRRCPCPPRRSARAGALRANCSAISSRKPATAPRLGISAKIARLGLATWDTGTQVVPRERVAGAVETVVEFMRAQGVSLSPTRWRDGPDQASNRSTNPSR
ncbi:NUDIX domain-containing protein [Nonomuraea sp. NPDC003804]|uniref:NUDIX domain-containing protein n=1 Tax=Nonomuraea sp. NPDC003804 TaxID=3154547 RepID=UPI0033BEF9F5